MLVSTRKLLATSEPVVSCMVVLIGWAADAPGGARAPRHHGLDRDLITPHIDRRSRRDHRNSSSCSQWVRGTFVAAFLIGGPIRKEAADVEYRATDRRGGQHHACIDAVEGDGRV